MGVSLILENGIHLPTQKKIGLVKQAFSKSPSDPIDFMFNQFNMSRRTKSTTEKFQDWIDDYVSQVEI